MVIDSRQALQGQQSYTIIDAHTHVASTDFIPLSFLSSAVENVHKVLAAQGLYMPHTKIMGMFLEQLQDSDCNELASEMVEAGIEKAVLLAPDLTYALKD